MIRFSPELLELSNLFNDLGLFEIPDMIKRYGEFMRFNAAYFDFIEREMG
jgi:hypothetical protein